MTKTPDLTAEAYGDWPMTRLLDAVDRAAVEDQVEMRHILSEIGDRTIMPVMIVVALLLISPLSGVPGVPTVGGAIIVMLALQALMGRKLWLPRWLLRMRMRGMLLQRAVNWLRRPARWIDRNSTPRLRPLTQGPMRMVILAQCAVIPLGWPALEFVPGVTSLAAATIALFAFGLFARDGYFIIAGYVGMITLPLALLTMLRAAI